MNPVTDATMRPMKLLARLAATLLTTTLAVQPTLAQPFSDTDVPFVTSPDKVTLEMLNLAGVGPTDRLLDLGSGDGRIVILAARRFGARGLGVEIVPDLVDKSKANARAAGVADQAEFRVQDLFKTDLSQASVITMYLLPEVNLQLRPALLALKAGTRLVSHDWDMGEWKPDRTVTVDVPDKPIGREKLSRLHLWVVPAQVAGLWCGEGELRTYSFELAQNFQQFDGALRRQVGRRQQARSLSGSIAGPMLQATSVTAATSTPAQLQIELQGDTLRVVEAEGDLAGLRGMALRRPSDGRC
jgi:SAM-dependent methyltransferase